MPGVGWEVCARDALVTVVVTHSHIVGARVHLCAHDHAYAFTRTHGAPRHSCSKPHVRGDTHHRAQSCDRSLLSTTLCILNSWGLVYGDWSR